MKTHLGHNKSAEQLKSIIERIESLEEQKAGICADVREVYAESKGNGYSVPAIRKIIKLRSMDANKRDEEETVLDTYMRAIGMKPLPLFEDEEDAA
jgi:uncharacterized protein (UPF0335 family)